MVPLLSNQRYLLHSLVSFGGRHIYRDHHDDNEYQRICSEYLDQSMRRFLTKTAFMLIGFLVAISGPVHAFIFDGIRTTTVEVAIPFVKEKSWTEFSVNIFLQSLYATHGAFFVLGSELTMEMFSNNIVISPRLIEHKLRKIISAKTENCMTPAQLDFAFVDMVRQCGDANG